MKIRVYNPAKYRQSISAAAGPMRSGVSTALRYLRNAGSRITQQLFAHVSARKAQSVAAAASTSKASPFTPTSNQPKKLAQLHNLPSNDGQITVDGKPLKPGSPAEEFMRARIETINGFSGIFN